MNLKKPIEFLLPFDVTQHDNKKTCWIATLLLVARNDGQDQPSLNPSL